MTDKQYKQWTIDQDVSLCPNCITRVQKESGCNHMTCMACGYEWCWLCREKYTNWHYSSLNPLGCSNLREQNNTRREWPLYKLWIRRILYGIGFLAVLPVLVLIYLFVSFIQWCSSSNSNTKYYKLVVRRIVVALFFRLG